MRCALVYLYQVITGRRRGIVPTLICIMLLPFSWLYCLLVMACRFCYEQGILKSKRLPCAIISIGNIVAGGTGKTPAVIALAQLLQHTQKRVAVISRGYRSTLRGKFAIVSDGEKILLSPEESGDEAYLLARSLKIPQPPLQRGDKGVPILIGKERFEAGLEAIRRWKADVILLDDGFQYWKLAKDLEVVTVDATQPFGTNRILPSGTLREPKSALRRADIILLTRVDQTSNLNSVYAQIRKYATRQPIIESVHVPYSLRRVGSTEILRLDILERKNVLAVCGIGNPDSFINTLRSLKTAEITLLDFPDHHEYTLTDIKLIWGKAEAGGVDFIITTEKDEQKLLAFDAFPTCPDKDGIFVLSVKLNLTTGKNLLETLLLGISKAPFL
ncbi:tetraacyldisaccharide 4'-kinase [Candidatus Poribacteria bacterium]|nr:tetraacyldisaccharide 4'-kinase [Candidatus Poribacteria bacterium]